MSPSVLLVSTTTHWLGTARIPRALANAGFAVALLTPPNSLAEKSRFVSKVGHLPDNATLAQWVHAFAAMVRATVPQLVLPCDDTAFRLLQMLVLSPPQGLQPALQLELASLIRKSLGDPGHYRASIDKTLLPHAAEVLGVSVPAYAVVSNLAEAEAFAVDCGYPMVLKRRYGFAGQGVAICADPSELGRAFAEFARADALDLERFTDTRLLAQVYVAGPVVSRSSVAWEGQELAGTTREKLTQNPAQTGPATVVRYFHQPEVARFSAALARGFGMTGFVGIEYIVDLRDGRARLLEVNRRITPGASTGELVGVDLCVALHAKMIGAPSTVPADVPSGFERIVARFPQEWLRDPQSRYLREYPVDAPWDDPELLEAMLAMRHAS